MSKKTKVILAVSVSLVIVFILLLCLFLKPKTYTVTFDSMGGNEIESQIIKKDEKAKQPKEPVKEGYLFVEWQYNNVLFDFNTKIRSDITLTAKWVEVKEDEVLYTVKFNTDGGTTISNQILKEGELVTKPSDPVKDGYIFKGWSLDGADYNFENKVEGNIEIVAKWEKVAEEPKKGSNNNVNNNTNNNIGHVNKPTNNGGNQNQPSGNNGGGQTQQPEQPVTPAKKNYTVSFNANGGSGVASQTVVEGTKATRPSNPTRNGYTFEGWTLNGASYNFDNPVNANITLVATWKEIVKNNYTVTFNSNGGSGVASQTVVEGAKATRPSNPTRSGHTFAGWTLNGGAYDFNSPVNSNITLTATWNQKNYVVKVSAVDDYSPARILSVYENGVPITAREIRYSDGTYLCSGSNPNVNKNAIAGETRFIIVLSDGTQVNATIG